MREEWNSTTTESPSIDLLQAPAHDSREVRPGVVLDFDANGRLVGIDVDHASKNAALDSLLVKTLNTARAKAG